MKRLGWMLLCASVGAFASPRAPTHAAVRRAVEQNQAALVQVRGPRAAGPGVVVGQDGEVLTSVQYVSLEDARVKVAGVERPAKVLAANAALKVAVVELRPEAPLKASAVRMVEELEAGTWLIGLWRDKKGVVRPALGQVRRSRQGFLETSVYLRSGGPLYDAQGRLVALCVQWRKRGCLALPIPAVKSELLAATAAAAP